MNFNKEAMFHDGTSQFCKFNIENNTYTFKLRTGINTTSQVFIVVDKKEIEMKLLNSDNLFDYFTITLDIGTEMINYHFRAVTDFGQLFYNMSGVNTENNGDYEFCLTPGFETPDWAKGAVMYQIFVDRFFNGDSSNDVVTNEYSYIGKGVMAVENWGECPAVDGTRQFYGGDLQGVMDKLDYLEKLGIQVIYLNPIFVSPSNHKYDTQDYDYVDPHFGRIIVDGGELLKNGDIDNSHSGKYITRVTRKENLEASNQLFIELVEEIHKRGMKVIIDGVFNHCGSFNKWMDREKIYNESSDYKPGAYKSKESEFNSFFKFADDSWPDNSQYEGWWGFDTLPKLNYEDSDKLQNYILEIGKKWVSAPFNVDGWRLDVAADLGHSMEFNHKFWRKFRKEIKQANPEAIIYAEHYGDVRPWLLGDQWDTVMNYDAFMDPVTWFLTGVDKHSDVAKPEMMGNAEAFIGATTYNMSQFQNQSLLVAMNELSNHDHSRFMTRTNKMAGRIGTAGTEAAAMNIDKAIFKQGVVMQMTLPGAPTLYYGDEAGVCGWTDPDNRRTYPWGKEDIELIEFYREMICIHKQNKEFISGSYKPLKWEKDFLAYGRFNESGASVVAINTSDEMKTFRIPVWQLGVEEQQEMVRLIETSREFYNAGRIKVIVEDGVIQVKINGKSSVIFKKYITSPVSIED